MCYFLYQQNRKMSEGIHKTRQVKDHFWEHSKLIYWCTLKKMVVIKKLTHLNLPEVPFKTANTDWNCLSFHFSHLSAILAKLTVTWYKRVDWTPFIFLVCCPFVPPFSSVCCAIQQPLYCIFTLTTNLRRPLWVNRWFQPYLVLRNEQLESKQSQVKTYPSIQVSNSK